MTHRGFENRGDCEQLAATLREQVVRGRQIVEALRRDAAAETMARGMERTVRRTEKGLAFVETWMRLLDLGIEVTREEGHSVARWYEGIAGFPPDDPPSP